LTVAAYSLVKEKVVAPNHVPGKPVAAKVPRSVSNDSAEMAGKNLVSATVYLLPDRLDLIKQICADKNRRISDLISEAVDDYLCKHR
jgi:hypothetical protein